MEVKKLLDEEQLKKVTGGTGYGDDDRQKTFEKILENIQHDDNNPPEWDINKINDGQELVW